MMKPFGAVKERNFFGGLENMEDKNQSIARERERECGRM